jgi:hypothetical protein
MEQRKDLGILRRLKNVVFMQLTPLTEAKINKKQHFQPKFNEIRTTLVDD